MEKILTAAFNPVDTPGTASPPGFRLSGAGSNARPADPGCRDSIVAVEGPLRVRIPRYG